MKLFVLNCRSNAPLPCYTEQPECHPELVSGFETKYPTSRFLTKFGMTCTPKQRFFTFAQNNNICQKAAFTLAEVLITLGIIGVVAAMTIPTLIANTNSQKYRSTLKKTISTLSQAARLSDSLYGFDYAGITQVCGVNAATERPESVMSICAILNGTLTGATFYNSLGEIPMRKNNKDGKYTFTAGYFLNRGRNNPNDYFAYMLSDGAIVAIHKTTGRSGTGCTRNIGEVISSEDAIPTSGTAYCVGFIDVNGVTLPNKEVSCSSGSDSLTKNNCVVKNDAQHLTDIYPIRFHDGVVETSTAGGRYVLNTTK